MSPRRVSLVVAALGLPACSQGPDASALVPAAPAASQGIPTGAPGALGWGVDLPAATTTPAPRKKQPIPVIPPSPMAPPAGATGHGAPSGTAL